LKHRGNFRADVAYAIAMNESCYATHDRSPSPKAGNPYTF
jgi:hypothetical protein